MNRIRIPEKRDIRKSAEKFSRSNSEAAEVIVADPVRYPGIMQEWARIVLGAEIDQVGEWRLAS